MYKPLVFLLFFFILTGLAVAQGDFPGDGDIYQTFSIDLNNDGADEEIVIKVYRSDPENYSWFGQLIVYSSSGQKIWAGPKTQDNYSTEPLIFGSWDYGYSLPEIVGDIDGDMSVELIATSPVSDVRFTPFKLFRWDGQKFHCIYKEISLPEYPSSSGHYPWSEDSGWQGRWISGFKSFNIKDGTCTVTIMDYSPDSPGGTGEAIVSPDDEGFHVFEWTITPR